MNSKLIAVENPDKRKVYKYWLCCLTCGKAHTADASKSKMDKCCLKHVVPVDMRFRYKYLDIQVNKQELTWNL